VQRNAVLLSFALSDDIIDCDDTTG